MEFGTMADGGLQGDSQRTASVKAIRARADSAGVGKEMEGCRHHVGDVGS
jgi:hypothetical protein